VFIMPPRDPAEAIRMLDLLLVFFGDGEGWARHTLNDGRGGRCLLGALECLERECHVSCAAAGDYLRDAIRRRPPPPELLPFLALRFTAIVLWGFNDMSTNFADVRAVILEARALAQADLSRPATAEPIAA
jgi:hypothetical protein